MLHPTRDDRFWEAVTDAVRGKVAPLIGTSGAGRAGMIAYLRDLEGIARRECDSREVVQVIASGRRLLGDTSEVGPADGPFART